MKNKKVDYEKLVEAARTAAENAYAPYSNFYVGAALLCRNGKVYTGCNMENAAYSASICAETVALAKAISEGEREFTAITVFAFSDDFCMPCGVCRQTLREFSSDLEIICANKDGNFSLFSLDSLIPQAFSAEDMIRK